MISNKIQVVYRLPSRITLMWPSRPNASNPTSPTKYNIYWDVSVLGLFATLLGSVENQPSTGYNGNRSYFGKVVFHIVPETIPGWNNDIENFIRLRPVIGGVEQLPEDIVQIPQYNTNGMRLRYPELSTTAMVGFNAVENRFIPVAVDAAGKVKVV